MKSSPPTKPFPWKCGHCRQKAVNPATVPYEIEAEHDGRCYHVALSDLRTPKCDNCGELLLTDDANAQITATLREQIGLLTPAQIRAGREELGLTQEQFAEKLRIASATVSRWETGAQIQQRALDLLMRLYFGLIEVRSALAEEKAARTLGASRMSVPA